VAIIRLNALCLLSIFLLIFQNNFQHPPESMANYCNGKMDYMAGMAESSQQQQSQEGLTQPSSEAKLCTGDGSSESMQRRQQWGCVIGVNYLLPSSSA
jgi:hypothetical protein